MCVFLLCTAGGFLPTFAWPLTSKGRRLCGRVRGGGVFLCASQVQNGEKHKTGNQNKNRGDCEYKPVDLEANPIALIHKTKCLRVHHKCYTSNTHNVSVRSPPSEDQADCSFSDTTQRLPSSRCICLILPAGLVTGVPTSCGIR